MIIKYGAGPGTTKEEGIVRIDIVPEWADLVLNIAKEKLPFEDNSVVLIEAHHILEHVQLNEDFLHVMKEVYRVLKKDGVIDITVPHKDSEMAFDCFQHTRFFNENSFMNFYSNPYAKEMGIPQFKCLVAEKRPKDAGFEVHTTLQK
jgi:predicted SAM-dependent methyltransferase